MQRIHRTFYPCLTLFRETKTQKCGHYARSYFLTALNCGQDKPLSSLALLRRKTGLPILKCKEALSRFEDMEQAEVWLEGEARREGMQRVSLGRDTTNGVVALCVLKLQSILRATMVEIGCETDHLSLGEDFHSFTSSLCRLIAHNTQLTGDLSVEQMLAVSENGLTVSDHINSFVGRAKENTTLKRGIVYECALGGFIGSYVHNYKSFSSPDSLLKVGTHAAIVHLKGEGGEDGETENSDAQLLADQLAQHAVGIEQEAEGKVESLLEQPWLFDPEKNVKSVLDAKKLNCIHLVRYELRK